MKFVVATLVAILAGCGSSKETKEIYKETPVQVSNQETPAVETAETPTEKIEPVTEKVEPVKIAEWTPKETESVNLNGDPSGFDRNQFSVTNLTLFRHYRKMLDQFYCNDPRRPYREVCAKTADTHNKVVDIGLCLERNCQYSELRNTTQFYIFVTYVEFREAYAASKDRNQNTDETLYQISLETTRLQSLLNIFVTTPEQ